VERALPIGARLEPPVSPPELVRQAAGPRARRPTGHRVPLLVPDGPGIGEQGRLDGVSLGRGEPLGQAVQVRQRVGLLLGVQLGPLEPLPHGEHDEGEQDGVDDPQHGVDEARDLGVRLQRCRGRGSAHCGHGHERQQHGPPDDRDAMEQCLHRILPAGSPATRLLSSGRAAKPGAGYHLKLRL
jgi:hypothetical protein